VSLVILPDDAYSLPVFCLFHACFALFPRLFRIAEFKK